MKKMNYRVTRCLVNGEIARFAILPNGMKSRIQTDDNGYEYFDIYNPYTTRASLIGFYGKIKDAIMAVREGYGDVIRTSGVPGGRVLHVSKSLDETVGAEMRQRTIRGWDGAKFAFSVTVNNKNSFSRSCFVTKNGIVLSHLDNQFKHAIFETEEQAEGFIQNLIEKAQEYIKKIENKEEDFDAVIKMIDNKEGQLSVVSELVFDLINDDCNAFRNEDHSLTNLGFNVIQCIVPEKDDIIDSENRVQAAFFAPIFREQFSSYFDKEEYEEIIRLLYNAFTTLYQNKEDVVQVNKNLPEDVYDAVRDAIYKHWSKIDYSV